MKKRDIILVIGAIAFIALVVCLALLLGDKLNLDKRVCGCPKAISQNFVWIFIILAIVFVASLLYYLFSLKIDSQTKMIEKNIEILYAILDNDEKKVLKRIISNNGEINQGDLLSDFDKIKAHRVLRKLEGKKIIEIIKEGKTNKIKLNAELKQELV